jgi:hypothetical protein
MKSSAATRMRSSEASLSGLASLFSPQPTRDYFDSDNSDNRPIQEPISSLKNPLTEEPLAKSSDAHPLTDDNSARGSECKDFFGATTI